jgi:hypothetical protein
MKNWFSATCFIFFTAVTPALINGQDSSGTKKPVFTANLAYQSLVHYLGRTDSLNSSAALAIAGYQLKNGLYAQGAVVLVQNSALPLQLTGGSVELGYRFPETDHFSGNVFVSKFLYKDQSVLLQSALSYQTGINASMKNKIINISAGADLKFSGKADIGITAGADHLFIIRLQEGKPYALALNPTITVYAGTQRFSTTYQQNKNRSVFGIPVGGNQSTTATENASRFTVLAYECTVPVVLVLGKFNALIIPSYVIPQNILSSAGEHGSNRFYITAGIGVRL